MTDETYARIVAYLKERGCFSDANLGQLLAAPLVVDEDVEMDDPVLVPPPAPPEVRVSPSDHDDLRRRLGPAEYA